MPLSDLEKISWSQLTHAYGSAQDVPGLIRRLRSEPLDCVGEESALWELFGNIWHQGTVYEATSYAVPFLLELIADPDFPKREGVVELLGAIASGSSYLDVHEDLLSEMGIDAAGVGDNETRKAQELQWVADAKAAVAKGVDVFIELTESEHTSLAMRTAETLSYLTEYDSRARIRIAEMLDSANDSQSEACLLMMLSRGEMPASDDQTFLTRLNSKHQVVRLAATASCLMMSYQLDSQALLEQMMKAVLENDFDEIFELPFEFAALTNLRSICLEKFTSKENEEAFKVLCRRLEQADLDVEQLGILLDLTFPRYPKVAVTHQSISRDQRRVLAALVSALESTKIDIQTPQRWGLPEYRRDLRNLVEGKPPIRIDENLPLVGTESDPSVTVRLIDLKPKDRIHHRHFGYGTIKSYDSIEGDWEIEFDDEGTHWFSFNQSDLAPESWWSRILGKFGVGCW